MFGEDNDSFMIDPDDPNIPKCDKCGFVTDYLYISPTFEIVRKVYDFSYTYDNRCIVSNKFKEFCIRFNYSGLKFRKLPNNDDFYYFIVNNIVEVDKVRKKYIYEKYCDKCNNYESITPGTPVFLKNVDQPLVNGFYATDVWAGSCNGKVPDIIVSPDTQKRIKKEKIKGVTFEKVS